MRPVPIPDHHVPDTWDPEAKTGHRRVVIAPPDGNLTNEEIRPVEAIVYDDPNGLRTITVLVAPEDGDVEVLQAGGHLAISFMSARLAPFAMWMVPPDDGDD